MSKAHLWATERLIRENHATESRLAYEQLLKERPAYKIAVWDVFTLADNGFCWFEEMPKRIALTPEDMLKLARWILDTFEDAS